MSDMDASDLFMLAVGVMLGAIVCVLFSSAGLWMAGVGGVVAIALLVRSWWSRRA